MQKPYAAQVGNFIAMTKTRISLVVVLLTLLIGVNRLFAQGYTESFDDISLLAGNGWLIQNNSTPVGSISWFQGTATTATPTPGPFNSYNGAANAYIGVNFNSTGSTGTISNWLITPNRTLRNGDVFTFYTRKPTIGGGQTDYPDRLEVRLSTNGASTNVGTTAGHLGDFTTLLLSINPTLVANVYPQVWTQYTITISGLPAPTSGRIAFRYFVTGAGSLGTASDYIGIDHVVYTPYVCPGITVSGTLDDAIKGTAYSKTFTQIGALGAPSFAITAGALPAGLTLSAGGVLSGTPTANGTFNFTVTASDASGCSGSQAFSLFVDQVPSATIYVANDQLAIDGTSLVTFTFNEPVTGFNNDDLTVGNGELSTVSSADGGLTWTATLTPDPDVESATNVITLDNTGVQNAIGNPGIGTSISNNYKIDTRRPTALSIQLNKNYLRTEEYAVVQITFSEPVSNFTLANLIPNAWLSDLTTSNNITWTATLTPAAGVALANNTLTLDMTAVEDLAGNDGTGTIESDNFEVFTQPMVLMVTTHSDTGDDFTPAARLDLDQADGDGLSLREALYWARTDDNITFAQGGTITLSGSQLVVASSNLNINGDIDGDGAPDVTVSGNNAGRVMFVNNNVKHVDIKGVTLTQGKTDSGGAGLYLSPGAEVTMRNSNISNNTETQVGGGAVYGNAATFTLIDCTVSGNTAASFGGSLRIIGNNARLNLFNTTLTGNSTTGENAHGGAIQFGGSGSMLTIVNSTISGNTASGANALGGGIRITDGTSYVYNSTIVGNAATGAAGGVHANSSNDTFANNVIAGNTSGAGATAATGGSPLATGGIADDVGSTIEVATNNYFGTQVTLTIDNNNLNNQGTANLLLGDLDYHHGSNNQTHLPLAGSALLNAGSTAALPADAFDLDGNNNTTEPLPVDANGKRRVTHGTVDIGAVEAFQNPLVTSVGSTTADGIYKVGEEITLTITFDQAVTVDVTAGTPTLLLETGTTDRNALYTSALDAQTLIFTYLVQAGDSSADLEYVSTAALQLNDATIRDAFGQDAFLTLPDLNGPNSISGQHALEIDGIAPTVTAVSVPADQYHKENDVLEFRVAFDEPVVVDATSGNPSLAVTLGTETRQALYLSGSGSDELLFTYTVQAGEVDLDGITLGSAILLNQATLQDIAGNDAVLTLQNVAATTGILVYAVIPTATLSTDAPALVNDQFTVTLTFSEAVSGFVLSAMEVSNATLDNLQTADNITYTFDVTPLADGTVGLLVPADAANNIAATGNTPSNLLEVEYDGTAPAAPLGVEATAGDTEVELAWTANTETDVVAYRVYGGLESEQALLLETLTHTQTTYTHTGLTNGLAYAYQVSAVDAAGNESLLSTVATATPIAPQYITFGTLADVTYGDGAVTLNASASSGLPVTYLSSDPAIAAIAGNQLTILAAGQVTISAEQAGDPAFLPAQPQTQTLNILKKDLKVTAADLTKTYGESLVLNGQAPGTAFTVEGLVTGDLLSAVTLASAGTAQQAEVGVYDILIGDAQGVQLANYNIAYVTGKLSVTKRALTLGFAPGATIGKVYDGTATASVTADLLRFGTGEVIAGDNLSLTVAPGTASYDNANAGTNKQVTLPMGGITLGGTSSGNYTLMNTGSIVGTVGTITRAQIEGISLAPATFTYDGTARSLAISGTLPQGASVSYLNNGRTDVGTQTVTANINGGNNYTDLTLAATLTVTPATRTLNFPAIADKTFGEAAFAAGATASTGETVRYSSSNTAVATVAANGQISIVGAGQVTITATLTDNTNYTSNPVATRSFSVAKAAQTISHNIPAQLQRNAGNVPLTVSASSGLPVALQLDDELVATISGTTLNVLRLGTIRITLTQEGNANYLPAAPVTVTLRVVAASGPGDGTDEFAQELGVQVHQAVSPNGDGINDFLIIEGIRDYPDNKVTIFNKNGTLVYETRGYNNGSIAFDGRGVRGIRLPQGTYYYILEVYDNGQWKHKKAFFVLRY